MKHVKENKAYYLVVVSLTVSQTFPFIMAVPKEGLLTLGAHKMLLTQILQNECVWSCPIKKNVKPSVVYNYTNTPAEHFFMVDWKHIVFLK